MGYETLMPDTREGEIVELKTALGNANKLYGELADELAEAKAVGAHNRDSSDDLRYQLTQLKEALEKIATSNHQCLSKPPHPICGQCQASETLTKLRGLTTALGR